MSSAATEVASASIQVNCHVGDRWTTVDLRPDVSFSDLRDRCCAEVDGRSQMCAVRIKLIL